MARRMPLPLAVLCMGVALAAVASVAQDATTVPTGDPFDICALPVTRLVFTLADLQTRDCAGDADCSSACACRAWATGPVTASTLALCVPVNASSPCAGDARDCTSVLATRNASATSSSNATTRANSSSNSHALNTIETDKTVIDTDAAQKKSGGMSTGVAVVVALVCAAVVVALALAANWYRNRPRSTSAPATVMGGIQSGRSHTVSELDSFDGDQKLPVHRGSLAALGPMHIDQNASIISGVSGASYHDIDGAHLGHLNQAHALTDTELSLSKDATERVFSPLSAGRRSELASFVSTDSSVAVAPLGHRPSGPYGPGPQHHHPPPRTYYQIGAAESDMSSFVSDVSTAYLTNNESFTSQLTMPESDRGSTVSEHKEVEF